MIGHRTSRVIVNGMPGTFLDIEEGDFVREGDPEFRDGKYLGRPFIVTKLTSDERIERNRRAEQDKGGFIRRLVHRILG